MGCQSLFEKRADMFEWDFRSRSVEISDIFYG